MYRKTCIKRSH